MVYCQTLMETFQRYLTLILSTVWGISALFFLTILFLAVLGGPTSVREISPSKIIALKTEEPNPASGSYRIPNMGTKSLLLGGLISPLQVSILENHLPLPVVLCSLDQFQLDSQNCYAVHIGRVYFSSSDGSSLSENGKQYEITWRWKPSPILLLASLIFLIVTSIMLGRARPWMAQRLLQVREWIALQPTEIWVITGFLISYVLFSFMPIFLNTRGVMLQNLVNVPTTMLAGSDHQVIVEGMVRDFFFKEPKFVIRAYPYPPFTLLFHTIFLPFNSVESYQAISFLTLTAFVLVGFFIPLQFNQQKKPAVLPLFFFITGLFSYGFQFEIERGQFNLIAVSLALASIWIFHKHRKLRWLSYLFFTMSVQLKIYPLIFILGLVDNWQDWKGIIKRFALLGALNFAALFLLGFKNFILYLQVISQYTAAGSSTSNWIGGHSINVFVNLLAATITGEYINPDWAWLQILFTLVVVVCFAIIVYRAYKQNLPGSNASLLLGCAVVAQLIPSVSFDYTLSMLPIILALFFSDIRKIDRGFNASIFLLILGMAYGSIQFSFTQKTIVAEMLFINPSMILFLLSAFPALFLLMISATGLSFLQNTTILAKDYP